MASVALLGVGGAAGGGGEVGGGEVAGGDGGGEDTGGEVGGDVGEASPPPPPPQAVTVMAVAAIEKTVARSVINQSPLRPNAPRIAIG